MSFLVAQASDGDIAKAIDKAVPNRLGLEDWLVAGGVVVGAIVLAVGVRWLVLRLDRRTESDSRMVRIIARVIASVIVAVGFAIALATLGIDLGPLLAGAGVLGIAIAFAVQDIVANYLAGVLIGIRRPFRTGDEIVSQEHEGVVEGLNFRYTTLRRYDGTKVLLPNAGVFGNPLVNYTVDGIRRTAIGVGVAYGTDPDRAKQVIREAASGCDGVLSEPEPVVWVEAMGPSTLEVTLMFWHRPSMRDVWRVRDSVVVAVFNACEQAGIDLPFPQRTVRVLSKGAGEQGPA